jgi:cytochrome b pre-mRNA-processing protein 3
MFSFYKTHNNSLYNNLVELSRNIFFYKSLKFNDNFETRVTLIFVHLSMVLIILNKRGTKFPQDIFDNIFQNIEYHLRELGHGDVSVNAKMKSLTRIFYDLLLKINLQDDNKFIVNKAILKEYFDPIKEDITKLNKMSDYVVDFYNFCFELNDNNMIKGSINFKFK